MHFYENSTIDDYFNHINPKKQTQAGWVSETPRLP